MAWIGKNSNSSEPQEPVVHDDGGTGLFEACVARFAKFGWTVECDAQHAVWVRDPETSYAVGLAPWVLSRGSLDQALNDAEAKLRRGQTKVKA